MMDIVIHPGSLWVSVALGEVRVVKVGRGRLPGEGDS